MSPTRIQDLQTAGRSGDEGYSVVGYEAMPLDTVITPVFRTPRSITVDIRVNGAEHGTIIPSTYVSAAGEEVTFTFQTDPEYTITNVQLDGVPIVGDRFIMPDRDVVLSGDCVKFEGGISSFKLFSFDADINQITHTIKVTVPKSANIVNARPEIEWYGNSMVPNEYARVDFSTANVTPVQYTITYGDDNDLTVSYDVYVYQSDYTMRIHDFILEGVHGDINQGKRIIDVVLPNGTDLSSLVPDDIVYSAENISPAINAAQDFRASVPYTLSTAGMASVTYLVRVRSANMDEASITQFDISGYTGDIDEDAKEINFYVPSGLDLSNIRPSMVRYVGKEINPSKAAVNDFSSDKVYTVYAQNGTEVPYTIKMNYAASDVAIITEYKLAGYKATIDQDAKTINLLIPGNISLVGLVPDKIVWQGKTISPAVNAAQDFSDFDNPVQYTVTAYDGVTTATYSVIIKTALADLIRFNVLGIEGQIDQTLKTVLLEFPYGFNPINTAPSEVAISEGATIDPAADAKKNFTVDQNYTVTSAKNLISNDYTVHSTFAAAVDNRITEFVLDGQHGVITDIGTEYGNIYVTLYEHRDGSLNISNIAPDLIKWSDGAELNPSATLTQDFSSPMHYYVSGENTDTRDYTVFVTVLPLSKEAQITSFSINGHQGVIEQPDPDDPTDRGTITVYIPETDTDPIDNVQPSITWEGYSIVPGDTGDPQDFSNLNTATTYTVTAEDPTVIRNYDVYVKYIECIISEYEISCS